MLCSNNQQVKMLTTQLFPLTFQIYSS
jgi:hypothetical protein